MKILAIIPACEGSIDLPNRNIRIINGKPLIYYSINNAKNSKYIDDIIVSSNSEIILSIAKQMGVDTRRRDTDLANPNVPLDEVIYDVMNGIESKQYDYVVTMQSISPNLKPETLDNAIINIIDNNYDTVISVTKKQKYFWKIDEGKPIALYTARTSKLSRTPFYEETGAFLITKPEFITKTNRVGENVYLYELNDEEALDVFTFGDLKLVEKLQSVKKVAFYVNGNNKRGVGHIYRALELADEFYCKPDIYYDINQTDVKIFGSTTHNLIPVNGIADLFKCCETQKYDLFINDILTTSIDYMIGLKSVLPDAKIVNFEDDGEGQIKADLVFNALLSHNDLSNVYSGEKYYISGKMFMFYEPIKIRDKVEKMFISFGGADPQNYSDRLLNIISKPEYSDYNFVVVLGRAKSNINMLLEFNKYPNIEVLYDVKNMPEIMSQCDIAITSRGRTGYELAILGIPSIAMAQNEREEKHGFVSNENGFTYIGLNPADEVIESNVKMYLSMKAATRSRFQKMLLSHNLKDGRRRIMNLIDNL